jgi:hypothetical protein
MHAAIRKYRVNDKPGFLTKVGDEFVDRVKSVDGFVGYYLVDGGDGTMTTITVGETEQAVETLNQRADDWIVENAAHLVESAPGVTMGEVRVRIER